MRLSAAVEKKTSLVKSNSVSAKSVVEPDGTSQVYFTKKIDANSLIKLYNLINGEIYGKVGIKLHMGEPHEPNILPRDMVQKFQAQDQILQVICRR